MPVHKPPYVQPQVQRTRCTHAGVLHHFSLLCRRLEQLLKRYKRGEIEPVEWLDHLTLQRIEQYRAQVACILPSKNQSLLISREGLFGSEMGIQVTVGKTQERH